MLEPENHVALFLKFLQVLADQKPNTAVPSALSDALGAPPESLQLHRRFVHLVELGKRALLQAETALPDSPNAKIYQEALIDFSTRIADLNFRESWSGGSISRRYLAFVEACANDINGRLALQPPTPEALTEVQQDVQAAIESILESDIEPEARSLLAEMLRELDTALTEYSLTGLPGVRNALERTIGMKALHRHLFTSPREEAGLQRVQATWARAFSLWKNVEFAWRQLPAGVKDTLGQIGQILTQ